LGLVSVSPHIYCAEVSAIPGNARKGVSGASYALPFNAIFDTEGLPLSAWLWLIAGGCVFFLVVEVEKLIIRLIPALRESVTSQQAGEAMHGEPAG
jgi:hypothetical protein